MSASKDSARMDVEDNTRPQRRHERQFFFLRGWNGLRHYKAATLAAFSLVLEAISLFLDVLGKKWCLLAAFPLAATGFAVPLYTCIVQRNNIATESPAVKQLLVIDVVFSVLQLIASFLALVGVKIDKYTGSIMLLAFAVIAFVFNLHLESTVVLKVRLHCEGCIRKITRNIMKIGGVRCVTVDKQKDLVTVQGTTDVKKVAPYLRRRMKQHVEVVPPEKDEGGEKEEAGSGDKKEKEAAQPPAAAGGEAMEVHIVIDPEGS